MSTPSIANKPIQMTIAFILNPIATPIPPSKMSLSFLLGPHTISVLKSRLDVMASLSDEEPRSDGYASDSTSTVFSPPGLATCPELAPSSKATQTHKALDCFATQITLPSFAELIHSISSWSPPPSTSWPEPAFRPLDPARLYGTNSLEAEELDHDYDLQQEEADDADDELSDSDLSGDEPSADWNTDVSDSDGTSDCPRENDFARAWLDEWSDDEEESDLEGLN